MASTSISNETPDPTYDKAKELLKAFDDTKAGVKGLVDAGITTIPRIFIHPPDKFTPADPNNKISIPIIDLKEVGEDPNLRKQIIEAVKNASETWGFFQVVNHGIPPNLLEEMLDGVKRFNEQDTELKKEYYTRDLTKEFVYNSNFDLYSIGSTAVNWRDTFYFMMAPNPPKPEILPNVCREVLMEYSREVMKLGSLIMELLSEALGLKVSHLKDMGCTDGMSTVCHYYPACPQPEVCRGTTKHSDDSFLTVLLQDQIGGLQVLHENQWFDVYAKPGALVVNIGDLSQLISNDRFRSVEHRVLANLRGPRISVACFFGTFLEPSSKVFGPIKELVSETNPPRYREITVTEFSENFTEKGLDGTSKLLSFRL